MHDGFGIKEGNHVTGEVMHEYLKAYAERSDLLKLIDFETDVIDISRLEGSQGWNLRVHADVERSVQTKKLVIATGVTNHPHRPHFEGAENFGGDILHSAELGAKGASLTTDPSVRAIAILGGGKSAYDAVYFAAAAGRQVEWIMRKSGKGPEWVFPTRTNVGPFSVVRETLPARRIVSLFSPCLWKDGLGWLRYFLHFTSLGKIIARKFWAQIHQVTIDDCGMQKDERTKVLEPETRYFLFTTSIMRTRRMLI